MMKARIAAVVAGMWAIVCPAKNIVAAPIEFDTPIVIQNAAVVPAPGERLENATILIRKGKIAGVVTEAEASETLLSEPWHAAAVIDATGLTIYAGFIDAMTHAGIERNERSAEERARVEDENPDVRDGPQSATVKAYRRLMHPNWRAEELYDPSSAAIDQHHKAGFTAALVAPKPAIFAGRSAVMLLSDRPLRRSLLETGFAQHAAFITSTTPRERRRMQDAPPEYPTTTMGAVAAFRQIMLDALWHHDLLAWSSRNTDAEPPPHDRDLEALWDVKEGRIPVAFQGNSEAEIHRALNVAEEFGLRPMIAGAKEAWKAAERLKRDEIDVILALDWPEKPEWTRRAKRSDEPPGSPRRSSSSESKEETAGINPAARTEFDPLFDEPWESQAFEPRRLYDERVRLWGEQVDNAARLHEAGVRFAVGSAGLESSAEVPKRLREAIKRGLPEDAALAALTRDAAAVLGMSDRLGEIAPGRLANLTVMTGPLADEKSQVKWVFVAGRRFDAQAAGASADRPRGRRDRSGPRPAPRDETPEPGDEEESEEQVAEGPTFRVEIEADRKPRFQTNGDLLIRNANLLTISQGDMPATDVLVSDGRIAAIGRGLSAPAGVAVLDLQGYFVMPGMIDAHSHMCSSGGLNEFSLSVSCEVRVLDVINDRDIGAFRALAGGITTVHTMHGSANTIGGQNATLRLKFGRPTAEWPFPGAPRTVKFALGENVKQSNFGRRGTRFPNTRMGVEGVMRRAFDAALAYRAEWEQYEREREAGRDPRPPRRDLRLEALADVLDGAIWVHTHCYRADEILRLLDVAETYGFRIAVLQHVLEGYRVIPEMRRHGCGASTFSDWWAYKIEAYDAIPHNAARMIQGGVVATVNSDSHEVVRHMNLEAAKSLRFGGLDPNDALRLVTLNGAIQLGIDHEVGSIEGGKRADLAIFDGHPLDTFARCVLTLIDGEIYFQHETLNVSAAGKIADAPPARPEKRFAAASPSMPIQTSAANHYWIVGGTIHPISGMPIENGLLAIENGRIVSVEPYDGRPAPNGVTAVSAERFHVYPGLVNAATSLGLTEIGSVAGSVDTGEIGGFQPDLLALSAYNPFSTAIEVTRAEGITSALVVPTSGGIGFGFGQEDSRVPVVAGQAGFVRLDGWSMAEARVVPAVGLCVALPSLPAHAPERSTPKQQEEQRRAHDKQMAEIEAFFRTARHYTDVVDRTGRAPVTAGPPDRRLEAMLPYMRGEAPVFFSADGYKPIREALRFAERFGLRPIILGGREAWKLADEIAAAGADVILTRSMAYPSSEFEPWDSVYRNAAVLAQASVRFCFATGGASLAKQLGVEAGMAVAHGLSPEQALRAVTLDAADILGLGDRLGSLEPGKDADVIITTDSPLQASNGVVAAFIGGRPVDLSSKHTRDDDLFQRRPEPPLAHEPTLRGPPAMRLGVSATGAVTARPTGQGRAAQGDASNPAQ